MTRPGIATLLEQCLADLQAGRTTLDDCLADHPGQRRDLEPLLRVALRLVPPPVAPDPVRKVRARYELVAALQVE